MERPDIDLIEGMNETTKAHREATSPGGATLYGTIQQLIAWIRYLEEDKEDLQDKAIAYDLDKVGIEHRAAESIELVDLRAKVVQLESNLKTALKALHQQLDQVSELERQLAEYTGP
jgi:hypothetical protein